MNHFATNLGVKPLGRGQEMSKVIKDELARFSVYQDELNNANSLKCPLAKAKALRIAFVNHLDLEGKRDQAKKVRELYASLKLPV